MPERPRLFYDNFLLSSTLAASSEDTAVLGLVQPEASGGGDVETSEVFTGVADRDFVIRIDVAGLAGAAVFHWSPDGDALSSSLPLLTSSTPIALQEGVEVTFPAGDAYNEGDTFRFKGARPHGVERMVDGDRDTEFRSAVDDWPVYVTVDVGSRRVPNVLAIIDHNLTADATVRIQAADSLAFAVLTYDEAATVPIDAAGDPTGKLAHYFWPRVGARFWRIKVDDPTNPDGQARWSEAFLGPYVEAPLELGDRESIERPSQRQPMQSGRWSGL
jgi:hypothetical protein